MKAKVRSIIDGNKVGVDVNSQLLLVRKWALRVTINRYTLNLSCRIGAAKPFKFIHTKEESLLNTQCVKRRGQEVGWS